MITPIPSTAGEDMRVWVGINLPYGDDEDNDSAFDKFVEFADEEDMLAEIEDIAALSVPENFVMFSNVAIDDIAPITVGKTFDDMRDEIDGFNEFTVDVFRTVAKVVATDETNPINMVKDWNDTDSVNKSALKLTYDVSHWWVFQWAMESWVAPRYDVDGLEYLNSSTLPRPWTYPVGTPAVISDYKDDDKDMANMLSMGGAGLNDDGLSALSDNYSKYIGENARFGGSEATNENTTHAFISTKVKADYEFIWDEVEEEFAWVPVDGGYGAVDDELSSIWLIKWDGKDYITSSPDNVTEIASVLGNREGLYPVKSEDDLVGGSNYKEGEIAGTPMLVDDFYDAIDLHAYEYKEGFVHFLVWINNVKDSGGDKVNNQYEILRNQFIHLRVDGLGDFEGTFPGYPGDKNDPEIPIDPNDDQDDDNPNPYPLIPTDPVDPDPTKMLVNVQIHDWIYRENGITLQR